MGIILILVISIILRFYNLPNLFIFGGDEEHQATLAQTIVQDFHIIWIGVNAGNLDFYLGPYWTYFTAFWLYLTQGHPLITGYIAAAIGVITTFAIYKVGVLMFSQKVGSIAAALYATLPLIVFFDQKYWNPTLTPLLSILLLYSLFKSTTKPMWLAFFAFSYGIVFHVHLSLVPIILVLIYLLTNRMITLNKKVVLTTLAAFIIAVAPLIVFDYYHKGSNVTTPLRINSIIDSESHQINPIHHSQALFQTLGRIWYLKPYGDNSDEILYSCTSSSSVNLDKSIDSISIRTKPAFVVSLLSLVSVLLFLVHKQTVKILANRLVAIFILVIFSAFLLFPGNASEYYLLGVFPLILLIPGLLSEYYPKMRKPIILLVLVAAILGIFSVLTNKPQFGIESKNKLIKELGNHLNGQPFDLLQQGSCHHYEGWRYLFTINGHKPERSQSDESLGWLYQDEITTNKVIYTVIMTESRVPVGFNTQGLTQVKAKGFTGYIIRN